MPGYGGSNTKPKERFSHFSSSMMEDTLHLLNMKLNFVIIMLVILIFLMKFK